MQNAIREGMARAECYGTAVASIQNSHHTACLSCNLQEATDKGYAIGLMTEILSGYLSGRGRAEKRDGWSASITLTLYAPDALAGMDTYLRQVDALVSACTRVLIFPR